jgi:tetratricopeptide (TPR) repeat protein
VRLLRAAASAVVLLTCFACSRPRDDQALALHRNLGKAFYENPTTKQEAVKEFQQALQIAPDSTREKLNYALALLRSDGRQEEAVKLLEEVQRQDPALPHTWFNLGIYYKRRGDVTKAIQQFEGMLARAPDEAVAHFQLGALYRQLNRNQEALAQFETAAKLDPQMAAARFQLFDMNRRGGNASRAQVYLADFQRVQALQKTWVIPEDVEWCNYAEIYDPPETRATKDAEASATYSDTALDDKVDPSTAGLALIDLNAAGQTDLLVWSAKGIEIFARGRERVPRTGLERLTGVVGVVPGDFNNDGLMDLCVLTVTGPELYRNTGGAFVRQPARLPARHFNAAVWVDFDHDYDLDLILLGAQPALLRNQGEAGWEDHTGDFPFVAGDAISARKLRVVPDSKAFDVVVLYRDRGPALYRDRLGGRYTVEASALTGSQGSPESKTEVDADFDGTGRLDRARIQPDGTVHLLRNQSSANDHWLRVRLKGVRSLKSGQDALVEIKAGELYRRAFYNGVPLTFDIGAHASVDVVRITWPNGLIQNEVRQAANQTHVFEEAQRLSGSCPMIWAWNGHEFAFIADVLGVAPLGARAADGSYFPLNHQEFVQIPGAALRERDGMYELRVTEELSEVSYLDQVQLYALDHPAELEIYTNEKFKGPPFPDFRLYAVNRRIYPRSAHTENGEDVLPLVTAKDQRYPTQFQRSETGVAAMHTLELDFGDSVTSTKANLVLNGWVDWPDGSTFRRAAQESSAGLVMPYLQVQDERGKWKTVNQDMGMPAGKPRTIVVPVEFLSAKRKVRIITNLCVYWDEIFLSGDLPQPEVGREPLALGAATLRFRGFSASRIDEARLQPDRFFYERVSPVSFWNPTPGLYTKFGPVDTLLSDADDRMVIMGSGDELRLQFRAGAPPKAGWRRDFLLKVDGWAKDRDPNTAFSGSVAPLPFHAMSGYPYPAGEHYPRDAAHDSYQRVWNTRLATAQIPALHARD